VAAVVAGGDRLAAGEVVIAGGAWSNRLGEQIGLTLPIYPQRGQIIHLDLPGAVTDHWSIVEWFGTHYMVSFGGERVVVGATREHESGYDVRATAQGVHEVLSVALRVAPGLGHATVTEVRIGLRPFSPDGLPVLGRAPGVENVWLCTGHGPSGIQLGPISGALIAAMTAGEAAELDLSAFAPERYQ
jgi:D-amino-acid dehydrogenase